MRGAREIDERRRICRYVEAIERNKAGEPFSTTYLQLNNSAE